MKTVKVRSTRKQWIFEIHLEDGTMQRGIWNKANGKRASYNLQCWAKAGYTIDDKHGLLTLYTPPPELAFLHR